MVRDRLSSFSLRSTQQNPGAVAALLQGLKGSTPAAHARASRVLAFLDSQNRHAKAIEQRQWHAAQMAEHSLTAILAASEGMARVLVRSAADASVPLSHAVALLTTGQFRR